MTVLDILKTFILPIVTFVAGIWVGRANLIGGRRYEAAEQILKAARAGTTSLHYVRGAHLSQPENPDFHPDPIMTTYARYQEANANLEELFKAAQLCKDHFGDKAAQPFRELMEIEKRMNLAIRGLMNRSAAEKIYPAEKQASQLENWKTTLFSRSDNDPITTKIDTARSEIENEFGSYLRPKWWQLLIPLRN